MLHSQIDVQIANYHLMDHIEWDLLSPLTPEAFATKLCMELGLAGEAVPLVAHAIYEELMKHKKDAIEWGVIGGDLGLGEDANAGTGGAEKPAKAGWGVVKDKTGLGLNWGRAPKDGRGPKTLKSVWRDWAEAEEFRTKFEELTAEEVERREVERERASRYVILVLCGHDGGLMCRVGDCVEKRPSFRRHELGGDNNCGWHFVTYFLTLPHYPVGAMSYFHLRFKHRIVKSRARLSYGIQTVVVYCPQALSSGSSRVLALVQAKDYAYRYRQPR